MKDNICRVYAAAQAACVSSVSPSTLSETPLTSSIGLDVARDAAVSRWWHCVALMTRLLGLRPFMSALQESGSLWSAGTHVVIVKPTVRMVLQAGPGEGTETKRGWNKQQRNTVPHLDEQGDAEKVHEEYVMWKQGVTSLGGHNDDGGSNEEPFSLERDYLISAVTKIAAFLERTSEEAQEAQAASQDKMVSSLQALQSLETNPSQGSNAEQPPLDALVDRMFPFEGGKDTLLGMLQHARMISALVYCTLHADEEASEASPCGVRLGLPPVFYMHDFHQVKVGCRVELCSVTPSGVWARRSSRVWTSDALRRAVVQWTSHVVATPGVTLHGGRLGLTLSFVDDPLKAAAYVPIHTQQIKFLTYGAMNGGSTIPRAPPGIVEATTPSSRGSTSSKQKEPKTIGLQHTDTQPPRAPSVDEILAEDSVAADLLHPKRRSTRRLARLLQLGDGGLDGAHSQRETLAQDEGQLPQQDGFGASASRQKKQQYEQGLAIMRCWMQCCSKFTCWTGGVNRRSSASSAHLVTSEEEASTDFTMGQRLALSVLLMGQSFPTVAFQPFVRLASPEIAWHLVTHSMEQTTAARVGSVLAAGFAVCLVEPSVMSLPLWYSILCMHAQKRIAAEGWYTLWSECVMRHPLLPSVVPGAVWDLLQRAAPNANSERMPIASLSNNNIETTENGKSLRRGHTSISSSLVSSERRFVLCKQEAASSQRESSPASSVVDITDLNFRNGRTNRVHVVEGTEEPWTGLPRRGRPPKRKRDPEMHDAPPSLQPSVGDAVGSPYDATAPPLPSATAAVDVVADGDVSSNTCATWWFQRSHRLFAYLLDSARVEA